MKSVLISIQPKWVEKIVSEIGMTDKPFYEKSIEIRKTRPSIKTPFKCYIYETKNTKDIHGFTILGRYRLGKVIGEFVCDKIEEFSIPYPAYFGEVNRHTRELIENACLNLLEAHLYLGKKNGYAWHISDLVIYDKPKALSEFTTYCKEQDKDDPNCDDCIYFEPCRGVDFDESDCHCNGHKPITRPPQSWCYVESLEV